MEKNTLFSKNLNLFRFKTTICMNKSKLHDYKNCFHFHSYKDRRRNCTDYYKNICKFYSKKINTNKICPFKNKCKYCHNNFELNYHPLNYKKKFCIEMNKCSNKIFCSFAHSLKEIKINLIHWYKFDLNFFLFKYKTEFCPIPIELKHEKKVCVYAHNYQDYKRPYSQFFINLECEFWKKNKFYEYDKQCENGTHCKKMHGWKEIYFYPDNNIDQYNDLTHSYFKKLIDHKKLKRYKNLLIDFAPKNQYSNK